MLTAILSVLWSSTTTCSIGLHLTFVLLSYFDGTLINLLAWTNAVLSIVFIWLGCSVLKVGISLRRGFNELMASIANGEIPVEYAPDENMHYWLIGQGLIMLTPAPWVIKMLAAIVR